MQYTLLDLTTQVRSIGRGVVFRAPAWDGVTDLQLTHLGDTEGDIQVTPNESFVHLELPELTGNAKHESYVEGEDPVLQIPLYVADPAVRSIITPTGNGGGGYSRRRPVTEHTLAIFPEEMFFNPATEAYGELAYTTAGGWTVDTVALTAKQIRLLGLAMWFWRGYFARPPIRFRHAEAGKAVEQVTFQAMINLNLPEGEQLYTLGDPADAGIVIDVA